MMRWCMTMMIVVMVMVMAMVAKGQAECEDQETCALCVQIPGCAWCSHPNKVINVYLTIYTVNNI